MSRPIEEIDYPKTADEWWVMLKHHKPQLLDLVAKYHPYYFKRYPAMPITAKRAERACQGFRNKIGQDTTKDPQRIFEMALDGQSGVTLVGLLNDTWFGMPESTAIHAEPGFSVLCDLCSEAYVLEESDEESSR